MSTLSLFLAPICLLSMSGAVPIENDGTSGNNVDLSPFSVLEAAIYDMLGARGVQLGTDSPGTTFESLKDGWHLVDFAGKDAKNHNPYSINNTLYQLCDPVKESNFFDSYFEFIEEAGTAMKLDTVGVPPKSYNDSQAQSQDLCDDKLLQVANKGLQLYQNITDKVVTPQDQGFMQWVTTQYPDYEAAHAKCVSATAAFQTELTKLYGADVQLFTGEYSRMNAIKSDKAAVIAGLTMEVTQGGSTITTGDQGNLVADYKMPTLDRRLTLWQDGQESSPFFRSYSSSNISSQGNNKEGAGGLSFVWPEEGVSGSGNGQGGSSTFSNYSVASSISVQFGSFELIPVERGAWFDSYEAAHLISRAADGDKAAAAKGALEKYFGSSSESPGPAAFYRDKALVVYAPTVVVQFSSQEHYNEFKNSGAGAKLCLLIICLGGSGSTSSNSTQWNDEAFSMVAGDPSSTAGYIVGFVLGSYW